MLIKCSPSVCRLLLLQIKSHVWLKLCFQALLTDLIRHPDYTWKEAKKVLKKDGRYDSVSSLEKSERERLFDDHIDMLISKKKENYWKLLAECKDIALDSSFKEIKKLIKDDPRLVN